jgi:hypothetical protein
MGTYMRTVRAILVAFTLFAAGTGAFAEAGEQLAEGAVGIDAKYPGDKGIEQDPAVLFADDFESCSSVADLSPKWDVLTNQAHLSIAEAPDSRPGRGKSLMMTIPQQAVPLATGVSKLLRQTQGILFLRWYQKFDAGWFVPDGSVHNGGSISSHYYDHGNATPGVRADGQNKFLVNFENENPTGNAPGNMDAYVYWPEQSTKWGDHFYPSGTVIPYSLTRSGAATFGKQFVARPDFSPQTNRWYCYEYMVKANTPGRRDGRIAMWVDGKLIADFQNLRLRDVATLEIDRFDLGLYIANNTKRPNRKWVDDVVAATSYIGPTTTPE